MIDKAIEKITKEMMEDGRGVIRHIEEHLTNICTNEKVAQKLLAEDKTLKGSYTHMESKAKEQSGGSGSVCISDAEGFLAVEEYFAITEDDKTKKIEKKDVLSLI